MFRILIALSTGALICAAQIALAEENVAEARAGQREVHGNDMTYHRHFHRDYREHGHYAERPRHHRTYVQ